MVYRNTPQSTTGNSPAKLMFGQKLNTRFNQLKPDLFTTVQKNQQRQKFNHDYHCFKRSIKIYIKIINICDRICENQAYEIKFQN